MVSLLGFLEKGQILIEHLLLGEGDPIEAGELLALLVSTPVGTSYTKELDGLDITSIGHVWSTAQVGKFAL